MSESENPPFLSSLYKDLASIFVAFSVLMLSVTIFSWLFLMSYILHTVYQPDTFIGMFLCQTLEEKVVY